MTSAILPKGGNCSLNLEEHPGGKILVSLGFAHSTPSCAIEIDTSAFLLRENGMVRCAADFIFYNQPADPDSNFICLLERQAPSAPEGGQVLVEQNRFSVELCNIPQDIHRIVFCMTIHDAEARRQNFGMVEQVHLQVTDGQQAATMARFDAPQDFSTETAIQVGELYRRGQEWKLRAIGQGYAGGLAALAIGFGVHVDIEEDSPGGALEERLSPTATEADDNGTSPSEESPSLSKKRRRSTEEILATHAREISAAMKPYLPQIAQTLRSGANESSTRILLDRILHQVLGYSLEEIKAEHKIQGRTADYVLAPGGQDTVVIEVKRIGAPLRQKQIFQATSYAAYAGIRWALLTNVTTWQLYRVSATDKIEPHLVFTIDLHKHLSEDAAHYFSLISRKGIVRKTPLDRLWQIRRSLSTESLIGAMLHEDVLGRIRAVIARDNGVVLDMADIKAALEQDIFKLG